MSAVNDGSCSPWVMCSCSVVRGNQIHDNYRVDVSTHCQHTFMFKQLVNVSELCIR